MPPTAGPPPALPPGTAEVCDRFAAAWRAGRRPWVSVPAHGDGVNHLAYDRDARVIATAGADGLVKLWDAAAGQELRALRGHVGTVFWVAFSPDGSRLASGSADNTARVWDVATGREVLRLRTHVHYIYGVAFSPDGTRAADASGDGNVTLYDTATGRETLTLRVQSGEVIGVAFSPDGSRLLTWGRDGTIRARRSTWPPADFASLPPRSRGGGQDARRPRVATRPRPRGYNR